MSQFDRIIDRIPKRVRGGKKLRTAVADFEEWERGALARRLPDGEVRDLPSECHQGLRRIRFAIRNIEITDERCAELIEILKDIKGDLEARLPRESPFARLAQLYSAGTPEDLPRLEEYVPDELLAQSPELRQMKERVGQQLRVRILDQQRDDILPKYHGLLSSLQAGILTTEEAEEKLLPIVEQLDCIEEEQIEIRRARAGAEQPTSTIADLLRSIDKKVTEVTEKIDRLTNKRDDDLKGGR